MRNVIPIIFVVATVLVGCHSPSTVHPQITSGTNAVAGASATISTNALAGTNAAVSANVAGHVNTPSETQSENLRLAGLGAAFLVIMPVILALKRS
jgi:hypothetical protein